MRFTIVGLMILFSFWGCQKDGAQSGLESLVGPHPTAVHAAVEEFKNTIPLDPKFQSASVREVKVASRKFLRESTAKVFVELHYRVDFTNDAHLFCGLLYSWSKRTKLVLLEEERPCEQTGVPPTGEEAGSDGDGGNDQNVSESQDSRSYDPTTAEKAEAQEKVESYFINETPEAEFSSTAYIGTTGSHGEVEVSYKITDAGEILTCTSLFGYDFKKPKVFSIELSDCHP